MATVKYSIDSATQVTAGGDAWPTTAGIHIVRLHFKDAPYGRRCEIEITSTDDDAWGVRSITLKGQKEPQEASLT